MAMEVMEVKLHRGVWAGHRFDVAGIEIGRKPEVEEWKNVSEEVVDEVGGVFNAH